MTRRSVLQRTPRHPVGRCSMTLGRCALLLAMVLGPAACTGPMTRVSGVPPESAEIIGPAKEMVCGTLLFGVIPIGVNNRAAVAYERARRDVAADGLTDVKIVDSWSWIFVGQRMCTEVQGMGYRIAGTPTK